MSNVVELPTAADARNSIALVRGHLADAGREIVWQIRNQVWDVLGYEGWDEMREAEYGGAAVMVPRADRPELVAALRNEGLSQQQSADTLGVSIGTVHADERSDDFNSENVTRTDSIGRVQPISKPRSRRAPLPDQARNTGWELRKSIERLQRLAADDRFNANKEAVAPQLRGHLTDAIEVCQDLLDRFNN